MIVDIPMNIEISDTIQNTEANMDYGSFDFTLNPWQRFCLVLCSNDEH